VIRSIHDSGANSLPLKTVCLLLVLGFEFGSASAEETKAQQLYEAACTQCHSLAPIEKTRNGRTGWEDTVHKMVITGAQLDVEEIELVIDYLYQQHGPDASNPMRTGVLPFDSPLGKDGIISSENVVLPEGEGKTLLEAYCMMCHDLGRVVATRRGEKEWKGYVKDMLRKNSMSVSEDKLEVMLAYLSQHFGNK
jgi:cytochrome c5